MSVRRHLAGSPTPQRRRGGRFQACRRRPARRNEGIARADDTIFGKTGPSIGNSLLVGRLLHVALFARRSSGIVAVRNDPYDARVRRLYEDMGFQAGEYLPLDDFGALAKTFAYVDQTYQHPAAIGRLSLATPPLPL